MQRLGLALLLTCLLAGCNFWTISDQNVSVVRTEQLRSLMAQNSASATPTVLIDVRPQSDAFAAEHIPDAIHIPLPDLRSGDPRLSSAKRIIVYSGSAEDYLSTASAKKLMSLGYSTVMDYRGGLAQWKHDKQPTASQ